MDFRSPLPFASAPRRGLIGWRALGMAPRRRDAAIVPAEATPAHYAEWLMDRVADHLSAARDEVALAYREAARYRRDPRWGRVTGNPVAREHLRRARLRLRMARQAAEDAARAAAFAAAAPPGATAADAAQAAAARPAAPMPAAA